ncbi:scavenger receptor class B member 1 isoform X2 [Rhinatrema bivittatum]|uniref:scavenger receptor class B member 1 isoform X2 n=1 Tax=Rhinatrema bivittatum TaxID=194408 RepID=UPI001125F443|nr:scavenger receptor class B member 1 isoform X2 [Rhinatrema bivittatum]
MAVSKQSRATIILVGFGLILAAFGTLLVFLLPKIINDQVEKNVRIDPSGFAFEMWKDLPVPFHFSVYVFEILNEKEILAGEKPHLAQRGPYVYREYKQKTNISFHNDTVSFLGFRHFYFVPEKSNGTEQDYIVVPNMLVLTASSMVEHSSGALQWLLSGAFSTFGEKAFMNRTVGEMLWGYNDPLVDFLNSILPGVLPFKGKIGLFSEFNNSNTGLFSVFTGMDDIKKVHMVDSWNGQKELKFWNSKQCNMINGTAGEMWAPFVTPSTDLAFYSPDACRSMSLVYEKSGEFKGIPTYRFVAPNTLFANGTSYPPNEGFCPCLESGVQNVSSCRFNAPVFMSFPHFYNADPVFVQAVKGINPSASLHALFLDLHPLTGIPMNCSIKLQLNIYIKSISHIAQTGKIKPVLLPVLWFTESGYIDGPILSTYYTQLVLMPSIFEYLQYILIALGGLLIVIGIIIVTGKGRNFLFWSNNKKGKESKEVNQPHSENLISAPNGIVLQEASL